MIDKILISRQDYYTGCLPCQGSHPRSLEKDGQAEAGLKAEHHLLPVPVGVGALHQHHNGHNLNCIGLLSISLISS